MFGLMDGPMEVMAINYKERNWSYHLGAPAEAYKDKCDVDGLIGLLEAAGLFVKMKFAGYGCTAGIEFGIKDKDDLCKAKTTN